jgi:hypothetical protein
MVKTGEKNPSFGLQRFKQGLRFVPLDDEGFTLRGDKQRLLYKGRRRSHRFTILGDKAFEYDCILLKEPETNIVTLRMEGAENFDFFRQPDFVKEPFLKGSYAVYKKETLIGEGTGKLCHIHRPEIIDARGRRCWGELAVAGNELRITIPQKWLEEAKYPVIVDPTIGTTTAGAFNVDNTTFIMDKPWEWPELNGIELNKYLIPQNGIGQCIGYFYCGFEDGSYTQSALFSNNSSNEPYERLSRNEEWFDTYMDEQPEWKQSRFTLSRQLVSGEYIWFGFNSHSYFPNYDYGTEIACHVDIEDEDLDDEWYDQMGNAIPSSAKLYFYNRKWSWYFTYEAIPQNFVRKITQGVKLTDNRKLTGNYTRSVTQTAGVNSAVSRLQTLIRKCVMNVNNSMNVKRFPSFFRKIAENIKVTTANYESRILLRKFIENVKASPNTKRIHCVIRKVQDFLSGVDHLNFSVLFFRSVVDGVKISQYSRHLGEFFRGLRVFAGSEAETTHKAQYYRFQKDTVQAAGTVLRSLFLFIRIVSKIFIRDYLLRRFLISKDEITLKSCITREIVLESKIN